MKKWFAYAGIAASVILVAFGIGAIVIGVDGYNTVRDEIAAQNITAGDDAAELTDGRCSRVRRSRGRPSAAFADILVHQVPDELSDEQVLFLADTADSVRVRSP